MYDFQATDFFIKDNKFQAALSRFLMIYDELLTSFH